MKRNYNELIHIPTLRERFEYLRLDGCIGEETFGAERFLNQAFYHSPEWKRFRRDIIMRDMGHEMAMPDDIYEIPGLVIIHHMNPIVRMDLRSDICKLMNPDEVVCVSDIVHKAIHYGNEELLPKGLTERKPFDMCPWR